MNDLFSDKPLTEMGLDELKKQERLLKLATWVMSGVLVIWTASSLIYLYLRGSPLTNWFFLTGLLIVSALLANRLEKIKTEITSRG